MERIQLNGENVEFKLDCGADVHSKEFHCKRTVKYW